MTTADSIRHRVMTPDERRGYDHALDSLALWARQVEEQMRRVQLDAQGMRNTRHMALALKHGTGGPRAPD